MEVEQIEYGGWSRCYRLQNDLIDWVITGDVGPRIIRLGFRDEENLFCEVPEQMGAVGGEKWRIYGGHRFWHAPEEQPRTYYPDNEPIEWQEHADFIRVIQPIEKTTGIQKELDIYMNADAAHVRVVHRLTNRQLWAVELAPWALSVMAAGTRGIAPLPPRGDHETNLLPTHTLTMWAYTDMSDPRWQWGHQYIQLQQDSTATTPQKAGISVRDGWLAGVRDGYCFLKLFTYQEEGNYPDRGCSVEMFTNDFMLELETLGPLTTLQPDSVVEHVEDWFLFQDLPVVQTESDVEQHILPKVQEAQEYIKHI